MRTHNMIACRFLAGTVLTVGVTLAAAHPADARTATGHARGEAVLDRAANLAGQNAAFQLRERHLGNELDWFTSHDRTLRAENVADRLQRVTVHDNRLTRREDQLVNRFDALNNGQVSAEVSRKLGTIQDEVGRSRALNLDEQRFVNGVDSKLSRGIDTAGVEATADRIQHLTRKDFRFAKTEDRMSNRLDARLDD